MVSLRILSAVALVAVALLAPSVTLAQDNSGAAAVAPGPSIFVPEPAASSQLRAGAVRGTLTSTPGAGRYSAGTSAFAQIRLSSDSNAKRGIAAELRLETEHGEIVGVIGAGVETDIEDGVYTAHIEGLRQGRDRSLLIEVKLRAAAGNPSNKLKLTLRAASAEANVAEGKATETGATEAAVATALVAWPVSDCAAGYQAALRQIGANKGNRLREIWRAASRPEKTLRREWLFRPALPKSSPRRRQAATAADITASVASPAARDIFIEAGRLLRAGYDPALGSDSRWSDTLGKTSNDLRKYFSQDANAAICTGAVAFTNYYDGKLSPLRKRGERLSTLSGEATQLAQDRADTMFETARGLPMGHPGWGGATLAALRPIEARSRDLKAMVGDLVEVAGLPDAFIAELRMADGPYAALRAVEDHGLDAAELPKDVRADLRQALSAIEAAVLLDMFAGRYAGFWDGFYGSLEAIREAHNKNCVCDG